MIRSAFSTVSGLSDEQEQAAALVLPTFQQQCRTAGSRQA